MLIFTDGEGGRIIKLVINIWPLNLLHFMMSKFLGYRKKIRHVQGQRPSINCAHSKRVCRLIVVCMHMNYRFPAGNENVLLSQRWTNFILPSEFRISIHNDRNHPILSNYENKMIRISLYTSHFSLKGEALSSELLIYFKYNNHIQDRKLVLEVRNMDVMVNQ